MVDPIRRHRTNGKLLYLIGPSGAGKDSLLQALPQQLPATAPVIIAQRFVTRDPGKGSENHISLNHEMFRHWDAQGCFALTWASHGCLYGIGTDVDDWLTSGWHVLVNGSRAALDRAERHWGEALIPVTVRVDPSLLEQRLQARGREDAAAMRHRLERGKALGEPNHPRTVVVDNNGAIEEATAQLRQLVLGQEAGCG